MTEEPMSELRNLLSIIFVVYGDTGPKVVFRYPHDVDNRNEDLTIATGVFKKHPCSTAVDGNPEDSRNFLNSLRDTSIESVLIPKKVDGCHKRFVVAINSLVFVGYPFLADPDTKKMYNIVFVVEKGTEEHIIDSLVNLSTRMSVALAYEERHCSYITNSLMMIDRHYCEADIPSKEHIDPRTMDDQEIYITEHCPFRAMIEEPNSLAANLGEIFDSIRNNMSAKVLINKTVNFSFFINLSQNVSQRIRPNVAPYESFVMLEDPALIKNSLNLDSSPSLIKLLDLPRPYFRSLRDIALSIDLEYDEICEAVLALLRWRKVLILYPIVSTNEYMVSHAVPISHYPQYDVKFREEFKDYDFYTELSKFSERTNLSEILDLFQDKETIDCYKMIIVWFLRRKLLVQIFAHVYLKPPPSVEFQQHRPSRLSVPTLEVTDEAEVQLGDSPSKSSCPSLTRGIDNITEQNRTKVFKEYLSSYQIKRLREMNVENYMFTNFAKILPHAHAGKTIEEILWRTNLPRQELHDIADTFSEFLITIKHPASV